MREKRSVRHDERVVVSSSNASKIDNDLVVVRDKLNAGIDWDVSSTTSDQLQHPPTNFKLNACLLDGLPNRVVLANGHGSCDSKINKLNRDINLGRSILEYQILVRLFRNVWKAPTHNGVIGRGWDWWHQLSLGVSWGSQLNAANTACGIAHGLTRNHGFRHATVIIQLGGKNAIEMESLVSQGRVVAHHFDGIRDIVTIEPLRALASLNLVA